MKYLKAPLIVIFALTFAGCHKESNDVIEEITDDCVLLSELRTKTNYILPFKLYHDIDSGLNRILLNNEEMDLQYGHALEFTQSGFFELVMIHTGGDTNRDTLLFTLGTEERQFAEWGIQEWTPSMFNTSVLINEEIQCIYPKKYTDNIDVPFLFIIDDGENILPVYASAVCQPTLKKFYIKRGIGSVLLNLDISDGSALFDIGGNIKEAEVEYQASPDQELSGEITGDITIPANTLVKVTGDIHLVSGASLTIEAGVIILINESVNIVNEGPVIFNGELNNPILVTCSERGKYWGGFISSGTGAAISSNYTFFCQSGYHNTGEYSNWGHAGCQALFYTEESLLNLSNCYILTNKGQIFYPQNASLSVESVIIQRAKTGGQLNYTDATIINSIFCDFPNDSLFYEDNDNDALYINASDVTIDNCTFMFAKDDGMDSGLDEGGTVTVSNSWFEACFHEGAALSSKNSVIKTHTFLNCTFFNCGQGIELGFSSPNHSVTADNCRFLNNCIGIRYGDNYDWSEVNGFMVIKNSQSLYNGMDVWNMVRMLWAPRLDHMQFENTQVSAFVAQYPDLEIITQ